MIRRLALLSVAPLAACASDAPTLDVQAPSVVAVSPSDGGLGAPLGTIPVVCFSEAMDPTSITASSVTLDRRIGSTKHGAGATPTLDSDGHCVTLTPPGPLSPSSSYEIAVTTAAQSTAGVEVAHVKDATTAFTSSFFTAGAPTEVEVWIPENGTLTAPLDLAEVIVAFSRPVSAPGSPLDLEPPGSASWFVDPLHAAAPLPSSPSAGESFSLGLSPTLVDADGNPPVSPGPLGFSLGQCAEGSPPSVTDGTAIPRDRDALLLYQVDRPCLCAAQVDDPGCSDAGFVAVPAACSAPYNPCQGGLLCGCTVPLVGLCPGTAAQATPLARGWNGQLGVAPDPTPFQLASPLAPLVITEVMLSPATSSRATGAFVEIANLGDAPVDLLGLQLANCAGTESCAFPKATQAFGPFTEGASTVLSPHGYALLVDDAFDSTQAPSLPAGTLLLAPLEGAPLISLSTTEPQPIGILAASGAQPALSTFDGSVAAQKGLSAERIDPTAPDPQPDNWRLTGVPGGTPGSCNSVTPADLCPEAGASM